MFSIKSPNTDGSVSPTSPLLSSGTYNLSDFTIEKRIGKGQFSEVYQALDKTNGRRVALKKVNIFEMMDAKARRDCIKEINLLQQLDHPNIVKHLTNFTSNNDLFIVLELAGGGDLSQLIKYFKRANKLIPERTIWKYFSQVAAALDHMHERRVMHRDMKPANIFMAADGKTVKLGDLGLGRFFSLCTQDAHSLVGTPYYMSPERVTEQPYDFKSDIWSMGCILYELAALQSPFFGSKMNLFALCTKIQAADYPPIPSDKYSKELKHLVSLCLQVSPDSRPTASQVLKSVTEIVSKTTT